MENRLLLVEFVKGDQKSFKLFFDAHYQPLCSYIIGFTGNLAEAEDIAQTSFIRLWNKRSELSIHTSLKSYLYKTAYNIYIDLHRKNKREDMLFDTLKHDALNEQIAVKNDVVNEKIAFLEKTIEALPPKCKQILLLKQEGFKYAEIALKLTISIKTVETQIGVAFTKIRDAFKNYNEAN